MSGLNRQMDELRAEMDALRAVVAIGSPISKGQVRFAVACLAIMAVASVVVAAFMPKVLSVGKEIYSLLDEAYAQEVE